MKGLYVLKQEELMQRRRKEKEEDGHTGAQKMNSRKEEKGWQEVDQNKKVKQMTINLL